MANDFTTPPTLPDATNAEVGDFIGAREFDRLVNVSNWLIAELRCGTAGQGWPDGQCSDNTAVRKSGVARWRHPTRPGQATWNVRVRAAASGGMADKGEVRIVGAAATLTLAIDNATAAWYTGTLATPAADYDTLSMDITGHSTAAGTTTVYEVEISPTPLTTPLATATVGSATPLGAGTLDADDSLPAWVGHALRANAIAFRDDYPRCVVFWSSLNGLSGSTGTPNTQMPSYLHSWWFLANPGAAARGKATAKVHVYASPDGVNDEHLRVSDGGRPGEEVVTVTGGGAVGWYTGEHPLFEDEPTRGPSLPYQHHRFAVRPGSAADGRTDAEVRSVCAWME